MQLLGGHRVIGVNVDLGAELVQGQQVCIYAPASNRVTAGARQGNASEPRKHRPCHQHRAADGGKVFGVEVLGAHAVRVQ